MGFVSDVWDLSDESDRAEWGRGWLGIFFGPGTPARREVGREKQGVKKRGVDVGNSESGLTVLVLRLGEVSNV